jgi:hypothetical protein
MKSTTFSALYFNPYWRTFLISGISGIFAWFLPIASPPAPVDLDVFCKNLNLETVIKDPVQRQSSIEICKSNSKPLIDKNIQFNAFQYFVVQWMLYFATLASLITVLSAYESKPAIPELNVWEAISKKLSKNDLFEFWKGFGETLKESGLLKHHSNPDADDFWQYSYNGTVSKVILLHSLLISFDKLSDDGKYKLSFVIDEVVKSSIDYFRIDQVAFHFLVCSSKLGYSILSYELRTYAILQALCEFQSTDIGSIKLAKIPDSLKKSAFSLSSWQPVINNWTILAKFAKSDYEVNTIVSSHTNLVDYT